ncbi:hypothetical protein MAF45_00585 [Mesosutterella sp. OilRF-GAM-744-9]|uniref:Uncharacterized protein n=1 Tax=Mesosutterella porci TaxID=2915351 RepID=A0ABS9MMV2_9BURK|nr:hypothetical protein [Mesosutterella sp. oilRF-744-WT-GAM-9]MCG5029954.1 hypothetical protein [Mesosutterella sp. oilRF-744-WT-GAM-9]
MSESVHQYIRLRGAPRERGLQYGRAAAERIRAVIRGLRGADCPLQAGSD